MKPHRHIKFLFVSIFLLAAFGCKKEFKTNTVVNFHLVNPVTQEGYAGVKVQVIEQEDVTGLLQNILYYEIEVTRNNITTTYFDTITVANDGDSIKLWY